MSISITYAYDSRKSFLSTILERFQQARPIIMVAAAVAVAGYSLFLSQIDGEFAAVVLAVLLASTVSSIAGFAFSAICGVMLLQLMNDPVAAVRIMMVCSIAIQSLSVALLWRNIEWRLLSRFLIGGIFGLPLGLWLLTHLSHTVSREAIGTLLIGYAIYALLKRPVTFTRGGIMADAAIGFAGGVTGGLAAFPGAFVTVWVGMKGWDKRRQRSVFQPYILIMQILALALMSWHRVEDSSVMDFRLLTLVPVALVGTWFGLAMFERLSDKNFMRVVNVLLLASGAGLLA
jgi:uncharacterized membrane protein YfcA